MKRYLSARIKDGKISFGESEIKPSQFDQVSLCEFSEIIANKKVGYFYVDVDALRPFIHGNGTKYRVTGFSNLCGDQSCYKARVEYENYGEVRKKWSRDLDDWSRSFVEIQKDASTPNYKGKAAIAINVLDHGFVALRNLSGPNRRWANFDADDIDPANSARMSFDQMDKERTREADLKLCEYLIKNKHSTPLEMIEVWIEMKMPIFVARQFVRHRTATINEVSGRYTTLPEEWYIPEIVGGKAKNAKQGQENNLNVELQSLFKSDLNKQCETGYEMYLNHISTGVAPEHARMFLHLNHYTHWLWKQDLHNLMHFLSLRDHDHAQIEARMYAKAIDKMIRKYLPNLMELYDKYRKSN